MPDSPYVLTRNQTPSGRFTIRRYNWVEFLPGEWVRTDGRVLSSNLTAEASKEYAARYVAENPGYSMKAPNSVSSTSEVS